MEIDLDKELYNNYLRGDKEALELLYNKYKEKIQYFIYNIVKDYQKSEDLTQETFLYVINHKMKEDCSFKYYIYLIAKSKAFNSKKIENRRNEIVEMYLTNENEKDVLDIITKKETQNELLESIEKLDEKYQNAIYLSNIEGFSYEETSQILGQTLSNTKNLIHRGKKQLRTILIKKGFDKMNKVSKVVLIVFGMVAVLSGITYATIILRNIFNNNASQGIESAADNDYIFSYDNNDFIESEGINVKVDSILVDDFNLSINFDFKLENYLQNLDIKDIWINDMKIIDENNNIVFNGYNAYSYLTALEENYYKVSFNSPSNDSYPKCKVLNISFSSIKFDCNTDISGDEIILNGNWKLSVDVPEKMYDRESITYKVKNCNDKDTIVKKAILSNTALKFEMTSTSEKIDFDLAHNKDLSVFETDPIRRRIY